MKKLLVAVMMLAMASPAMAWKLQWDAPAASEELSEVIVFENNVELDRVVVPATEYVFAGALPEACWTVQPVNIYGISGDVSNQVCVGRPAALGLRLVQ